MSSSQLFNIDEHGKQQGPRPRWPDANAPKLESHHGVLSIWMNANFPGYKHDKAPTIM